MNLSDLPNTALDMTHPLLRHLEGFRNRPYQDIGGVWTIGCGLTRLNGHPVTKDTPPITVAQGDAAMDFELGRSVEGIGKYVTVGLTPCQWAALISICYNCGLAPVAQGKGANSIAWQLNQGNATKAADLMLQWNRAAGQVVGGLVDRRVIERQVFLGLIDPRDETALYQFHNQVAADRHARERTVGGQGHQAVSFMSIRDGSASVVSADDLNATQLARIQGKA